MKPLSSKKESQVIPSEERVANRSLILGATFLALGTSVGLDFENSFVAPALGEQASPTPTPRVIYDNLPSNSKSADRNASQVKTLLRPAPNSNQQKAAADQQRLQIQQLIKENSNPKTPLSEEELKLEIQKNLGNISGNTP